MTEAEAFVESWSKVWRGPDTNAQLYMELLHEGCPLINPIGPITREDVPQFVKAVLEAEPDIRVVPTRWAETEDGGVLIEWVNSGTLNGAPFELRGADRYTLTYGKATEGYAYFDPRPFLDEQTAPGMTRRDTAEVIKRFNDAFLERDAAKLVDLVAVDCVMESTQPAPNGTRYEGYDACLRFWQELIADPEGSFEPEDVIVVGDRATIRWRYRFGDGEENTVRGVTLMHVRDGKIVEALGYVKAGLQS
jgi:ketosteroid isomerase-like protein